MASYTASRIILAYFTAFFCLTILVGTATPAPAALYNVLIERPGVWSITGSFESATDMWTRSSDISNWSFTAQSFAPASPVISVGPLMEGSSILGAAFRGSLSDGIRIVGAATSGTPENNPRFSFLPGLLGEPSITIIGPGIFPTHPTFSWSERLPITNSVTLVPVPSSALLLLTGLVGLAGFRWHHTRRKQA